jgi:tripartite ATP-independent transporter DctP family solute receptor
MPLYQKTIILGWVLAGGAALMLWPARGQLYLSTDTDGNSARSIQIDAQTPLEPITLIGASQFSEQHVYTRTIRKFEELIHKYYSKPINFEVYLNSELGLEKDYFAYMNLGIAVDYAIVTASHMSSFVEEAPLMDTPFLFHDRAHWSLVVNSDVFKPLEEAIYHKADVHLLGYAGGGVRNMIVNRPITKSSELQGIRVRVMGAPIQANIFQAVGAVPSVIAYNEVYNAIQTGVIDAAENEAAGLDQMKFYEVGPEIAITQHAFTLRPLMFSGKTYRRLPADLQTAILRAGREAGQWGREQESSQDSAILAKLEREQKIRTHVVTDRNELLRLAKPVKQAYAKRIRAEALLARIEAAAELD